MSAPAGRQRRQRGTQASQLPILGGRVRPEIHAKAHRAAAARGVTLALYLESLVEQDEERAATDPPQLVLRLDEAS